LNDEIERRLQEYISSPNTIVIVEAIQSYRVFIAGKVQKPGAITSEKPITVLQALWLAEDLLEFANLTDMSIMRTSDRRPRC